jgi:hypothetical protein
VLADFLRHGVLEDRADQLQHTVGRLDVACLLDPVQNFFDLRALDAAGAKCTKPREDMLLQSPRVARAVTLASTLLREPFARHGFERLKLRDSPLVFFLLPLSAGIDVVGEQPPRFVALLASTLERHIRIHAEREYLFGLAGFSPQRDRRSGT